MKHHKILITHDGNGFNISIPALKGCMAHGATLKDALLTLAEVKEVWLAPAKERGWSSGKEDE